MVSGMNNKCVSKRSKPAVVTFVFRKVNRLYNFVKNTVFRNYAVFLTDCILYYIVSGLTYC